MKRRALIIASDDKELPGDYKDIDNYKEFFLSITGGAWFENEITLCQGLSKSDTLIKINDIKKQYNDLVIAIFAGHGEDINGITSVQLNNRNECITQAEIENLSKRQISIYDCCRKERNIIHKMTMDARLTSESYSSNFLEKNESRKIYEKNIINADEQQVVLKSCSNNEYADDTQEGGLYSVNFIQAARYYDDNNIANKTAISAHLFAAEKVVEKNKNQNPEHSMPRVQNKLIISINPRRLAHQKMIYG